ncbi:hypothetical protein [Herbidospora mongoliensis]|uniref:hypothetical protein n=1 Tax=Herbidospora mongoliensis TaxID=688067 RepID=UPI000A3F66F7|nr:hypothetical protein [Herbidospora mongoliensis]
MSAELMMGGADAYAPLAEVATADPIETPEMTPVVSFITGLSYGVSVMGTYYWEC